VTAFLLSSSPGRSPEPAVCNFHFSVTNFWNSPAIGSHDRLQQGGKVARGFPDMAIIPRRQSIADSFFFSCVLESQLIFQDWILSGAICQSKMSLGTVCFLDISWI